MEKSIAKTGKIYQLVPTHKHLRVNSVAIIPGRYLVGRSESCDIVMPYSEVSAIHAILEVTSKVVRIYDMNSKNGTVINGQKIIAKEISVGDTIIFGGVEVKFCEYNTQEELPPVLPVLDPVTGNASTLKSNTTIPSPPLIAKPEVGIELPKESPKEVEDHIPYIVYPLASDPNSDYSEYIFEDTKELYPIFRYEINKQAVEVIILFKDRVYTVDYLPEKNGIYQIAGLKSKSKELEFPYFGKAEKVPFIEIHKGNCIVQQLHNYKMFHLMDGNVVTANDGIVNIGENDIVKLTNDDLEIYVRRVSSPPKVKPAPFFRRDKDLRKYLWLALLFVLLPLIALNLYEVDEKSKHQKDPERIATILYKQKMQVNKNRTVEQTQKKKPKKQTAPKKPVEKKTPPKKLEATSKKSNSQTIKKTDTPGSKQAVKVQKVKQVKKAVKATKTPVIKTKSTSAVTKTKSTSAASRRATTPTKTSGNVDVFKSFNFKSTINKNLAKGGALKGAKTAQTSGGDLTSASVSGGVATNLAKAEVGTQVGSLTGSTTGKIAETRGTKGLSAKTGVYTAGIPSETVVLGSMDPDIIRRILRDNIPFFRACYQEELEDNPGKKVAGTIRLLFTIGSSGHVSRAGIDGRTRLPAKVKGCVVRVLRGIKFPRPLGGGTVDVKQPFNFYPKRL